MRRVRGLRSAAVPALFACVLLVACTEEAPGPQFANEPVLTREATQPSFVATPPPPMATPLALATPSSVGDLLSPRGAPDSVYTASDSTVWLVSDNGAATRTYEAPPGTRILAFDPGPGSREVAVLIEAANGSRRSSELLILDGAGKATKRVSDFGGAHGTPVPAGLPVAGLVDWSPQGDRALVTLLDGRLFDVPLDSEGSPVELNIGASGQVVEPMWSPTGEAIAFISGDLSSRRRSLAIYHVADGQVNSIVESENGRFVVDFTWMPNGVSLLFTEGGDIAGAVSGIDLWRIDADGKNRQLMVSAGTVAPVARVSMMRPSPDGRVMAYAVLVPGTDAPVVDSVWIRDVASGIGYRIPLPSISAIKDITWTTDGLVISVKTEGSVERAPMLALLLVDREGEIRALWAAPIAEATPVNATPVGTPQAS